MQVGIKLLCVTGHFTEAHRPAHERLRELNYPPPTTEAGEQVVLADGAGHRSILVERADEATRILLQEGGRREAIFETDTHLAAVQPGAVGTFTFETRKGQRAHASLIRPPGWQEGARGPTLVWVYPGAVVPEGGGEQDRLNSFRFMNLQLLAAHGLTVLRPSIPITGEGLDGQDMIDRLCDAVLPAIERAVAAGLIDPANLHVGGHSMGGWAALALLAETDLFRSGIAVAATSNLVSEHGQFDTRSRYDDAPYLRGEFCERNFGLPGPFWRHLDAYVRNSPLFAVERITAPVLLVHGDLDYVPIEQAEAMFSALHACGTTVEFVRPFGDGHVPSSPANLRDLTERMVRWLNRQSGTSPGRGTRTSTKPSWG